ncbi:transposase [Streptomyces sp. NBC_00841]|uniref:transposase n=1 Tax=Streptomyces sp. NBC_00841 TaxID=2975847 RepID=UPI003FA3C456
MSAATRPTGSPSGRRLRPWCHSHGDRRSGSPGRCRLGSTSASGCRSNAAETRGWRGRASDREWKARRRLLRNREGLTNEQFATLWNALLDKGKIGQTLLTAWFAEGNLRNLLACARTGADRYQIGQARWRFLTCCADSGIPEVRQLATTAGRWWPEIEAFINTGHSNTKSEGVNRVIKLVARNAFGFRNADHQRLRTRCVTTRRARGHLRTAQLSLSAGPTGADRALNRAPVALVASAGDAGL